MKEKKPTTHPLPSEFAMDAHWLGGDVEDTQHTFRAQLNASEEAQRHWLEHLEATETPFVPSDAWKARVEARWKQERQEEMAQAPIPEELPPRWLRWWQNWGLSMALAAACLFFVLRPTVSFDRYTGIRGRYTGVKGSDVQGRLWVALRRGAQTRVVPSGTKVQPGDRIRLAVQWASVRKKYVFVVHRDGLGELSPLYPAHKSRRSLRLLSRQRRVLQDSFEVENKPHGSEQIWACFSYKPLSWEQVSRHLPARKQVWSSAPHGPCASLTLFLLKRKGN